MLAPRGQKQVSTEFRKGLDCAIVAKHFEKARAEIYGRYEKGQVCAHKDKDQELRLTE